MPCRELLYRCSCNINMPSVTVTNTTPVQNMPIGGELLQDGCLLDCGHSLSMPADHLSLNIACLLAVCFSICYTCWYGVCLSAVPAGMVSHYQPCLLAWYFIIRHAFWFRTACWCCASLYVMPSGVVPHCR